VGKNAQAGEVTEGGESLQNTIYSGKTRTSRSKGSGVNKQNVKSGGKRLFRMTPQGKKKKKRKTEPRCRLYDEGKTLRPAPKMNADRGRRKKRCRKKREGNALWRRRRVGCEGENQKGENDYWEGTKGRIKTKKNGCTGKKQREERRKRGRVSNKKTSRGITHSGESTRLRTQEEKTREGAKERVEEIRGTSKTVGSETEEKKDTRVGRHKKKRWRSGTPVKAKWTSEKVVFQMIQGEGRGGKRGKKSPSGDGPW